MTTPADVVLQPFMQQTLRNHRRVPHPAIEVGNPDSTLMWTCARSGRADTEKNHISLRTERLYVVNAGRVVSDYTWPEANGKYVHELLGRCPILEPDLLIWVSEQNVHKARRRSGGELGRWLRCDLRIRVYERPVGGWDYLRRLALTPFGIEGVRLQACDLPLHALKSNAFRGLEGRLEDQAILMAEQLYHRGLSEAFQAHRGHAMAGSFGDIRLFVYRMHSGLYVQVSRGEVTFRMRRSSDNPTELFGVASVRGSYYQVDQLVKDMVAIWHKLEPTERLFRLDNASWADYGRSLL